MTKYIGGVTIDLHLPSGVVTVAPGDTLDLDAVDTAALEGNADFETAKTKTKSRSGNTAAQEG